MVMGQLQLRVDLEDDHFGRAANPSNSAPPCHPMGGAQLSSGQVSAVAAYTPLGPESSSARRGQRWVIMNTPLRWIALILTVPVLLLIALVTSLA